MLINTMPHVLLLLDYGGDDGGHLAAWSAIKAAEMIPGTLPAGWSLALPQLWFVELWSNKLTGMHQACLALHQAALKLMQSVIELWQGKISMWCILQSLGAC